MLILRRITIGIFSSFVKICGAGPRPKGIRITDLPNKTGCTSDVFDEVEHKSKHRPVPTCTCNLSLSACPSANASLPFWSEDKEWMHSDFLSLSQVYSPHLFQNRLLKKWPFFTDVFWMAVFFNIDSSSFVTSQDSCADIFGWCGTFSWNGFKIKSIFRPDNHSKISGMLVNFFQCFTKYCSFPARGRLLTFTFWNKSCTDGRISLNWCNGTISGKLPPNSDRGTVSLI